MKAELSSEMKKHIDSQRVEACPAPVSSAVCGICGLPVGDMWPFHLDCEPIPRSGDPGDFNVGDKSGYIFEPNDQRQATASTQP